MMHCCILTIAHKMNLWIKCELRNNTEICRIMDSEKFRWGKQIATKELKHRWHCWSNASLLQVGSVSLRNGWTSWHDSRGALAVTPAVLQRLIDCLVIISIIIQGGPKSKPLPSFQKLVLKIANEIRFLRKVKVWIKHYNTIFCAWPTFVTSLTMPGPQSSDMRHMQ